MIMAPRMRKLALAAHVTVSIGWVGAVVAFLPLAVAGLISQDALLLRGAYVAMELIGWYALVPLAFASLLTGLIQAWGTTCGLFRHYWVLFKLLINIFATIVLLAYMQTLAYFASVAADPTLSADDLHVLRSLSPTLHASLALLLLLVAVTLAIYKPRGIIQYRPRSVINPRL
jgi:hypothetical protein